MMAPSLCNLITPELRSTPSLLHFEKALKTSLCQRNWRALAGQLSGWCECVVVANGAVGGVMGFYTVIFQYSKPPNELGDHINLFNK